MQKICVGAYFTAILDDMSNIYTFGLGDLGQLGIPHNFNRICFFIEIINIVLCTKATIIARVSPNLGRSIVWHSNLRQRSPL